MSLDVLQKTLIQDTRNKGQEILNSEAFTDKRSIQKVFVKMRMK